MSNFKADAKVISEELLVGLKKAITEMKAAVEEAKKAGDNEVYRFDFTPQNGSLGFGADWHPSLWQHQKMAGELTAFLRSLMHWF